MSEEHVKTVVLDPQLQRAEPDPSTDEAAAEYAVEKNDHNAENKDAPLRSWLS